MQFEVADLTDDRLILPLLEQDRCWSAYALCNFEPPYKQKTTIVGARSSNETQAVIVLHRLPSITALLPFGRPAGVQAIFDAYQELPPTAHVVTQAEHLQAIASRYQVEQTTPFWRMVLDIEKLPEVPEDDRIVALESDNVRHIEELYRDHAGKIFDPDMLASEIYRGIYVDGRLVATAGTHVVSRGQSIAAIGGVFTHPNYRSRGLARATTGAVARELMRQGIRLIVLNVRQDNEAALAIYRRLGFREWLPYIEGSAILR